MKPGRSRGRCRGQADRPSSSSGGASTSARSCAIPARSRSSPSTRDDRVVLVRQLREPARKELLELPAGGLEEGEEPLATAQRELREERAAGGDWRHVAAFWTTPGYSDERMDLFVATGLEEGDAEADDGEGIELVRGGRWRRSSRARLGEIGEDAKTLAGLLLYLRDRGL